MTYRVGSGLPSTLTVARIKSVLGLAKSHERALTAALDADASQAWTGTASDEGLYERLHTLFATPAGRGAYEAARLDFEGAKPKRSGRADLLRRLLDDCRKEAFGRSGRRGTAIDSGQELIGRLVEDDNWTRLAEAVWAIGLISGDAEPLRKAIADYPGIIPYLEKVENGLLPAENKEIISAPEADGEADVLTSRIGQIVNNLDPDRLEEQELRTLSASASRLADIAKAREIRDRHISFLKAQIEDWEEKHPGMATDAIATLKTHIEEGDVDRTSVSTILDLATRWASTEASYRETREKLIQAVEEDDFDAVRSHTDATEAHDRERKEVRSKLDTAIAALGSEGDGARIIRAGNNENRADDEENPDTSDRPDDELGQEVASPTDAATEPVAYEEPTSKCGDPAPEAGSSEETATPDDEDEESASAVEDAITTAIGRGRFGLAYHIARETSGAVPSAAAIRFVACNHVTDARAPVSVELSHLADILLKEAEGEPTNTIRRSDYPVLITCAALAPALEAPGGPVAQLLSFLADRLGDMPSLCALARTAAEVSMTGAHLPVALLREEDWLETWHARETSLRNETQTWIAQEKQSKIRFQAATRVWRRMLEDWEYGGRSSLGRIFRLLESGAENLDVKRIYQICEYWRVHRDREIDRIDRGNRSSASTNQIDGPARVDLREKVDQALTLCERWLSLIQERPDSRRSFHSEHAGRLRTAVTKYADGVRVEIDALRTPVAQAAGELLERYTAMFKEANRTTPGHRASLADLLNGDLLADPSIEFDGAGEPSSASLDLNVLLKLLQQDPPNFEQAAVDRAIREDFTGAEATIDFADRMGHIDSRTVDRSRARVEEERKNAQENLKNKIRNARNRLDAAYARGALTLQTYQKQRDRLPFDNDLSETEAFARLNTILKEIDREIDGAQTGRRNEIRQELDALEDLSINKKTRIESALDDGLFQIAEDFIERIRFGEELPSPETPRDRPFDRFFPHFVDKYSVFCETKKGEIEHVRSVVESRSSIDFLDARGLSKDASRDGIGFLDLWIALRGSGPRRNSLQDLMKALGFADVRVRGSNKRTLEGETRYDLQVLPIADRNVVQLPDFGSRAVGRYCLVPIRGRVAGEAIVREVGRPEVTDNFPTIVLFFGVLDANSRRSIARAFGSDEYRRVVVLDEALAAFLALQPGNRLRNFFDCTSGFTFSQPFDPDAAELPPEMFFGRIDERKKIVAMSGDMTHFVYGGRRLGKTALLRDIAREYRSRAPDELVLYINLKSEGIGENRPTEDLWPLFAEQLAERGVLQPRTVQPKSIENNIIRWLDEKPDRRILLLVDEADVFLDAESRPEQRYQVLEQIKRLMEQTERKFKVVFAGLHNVQRAARDPNTPFAHLGEAINIGPMLPETDGDGIENLIRAPLEALGYRFASNDSVIRIAAETNYYPALAQQFCKELLRTLREETKEKMKTALPISFDRK